MNWEKDRISYFAKAATNPKLIDEAAGPPADGFVFEDAHWAEGDTERQVPMRLSAWVPPALQFAAAPRPATRPLPLSNDHVLTLHEKYAVLAAVHDAACKGVEKVDPWLGLPVPPYENAHDGMPYGLLVDQLTGKVPDLTEADNPALSKCFSDVKDDIIANAGAWPIRILLVILGLCMLAGAWIWGKGQPEVTTLPWAQLVILALILIIEVFFVIVAVRRWGSGENLLQKLVHCWPLSPFVLAVAYVFSVLVLRKEGLEKLKALWALLTGGA